MLDLPGAFVSEGVSADLLRAGEPRLWRRRAARRRALAVATVTAQSPAAGRRVHRPATT